MQFPAITVCNTNVLNYGGLRSNVTVGLPALDGVARDANGGIDLHVAPIHLCSCTHHHSSVRVCPPRFSLPFLFQLLACLPNFSCLHTKTKPERCLTLTDVRHTNRYLPLSETQTRYAAMQATELWSFGTPYEREKLCGQNPTSFVDSCSMYNQNK